jgi:predicted Co/Zn/Cd cation transporter (cation efflux family)
MSKSISIEEKALKKSMAGALLLAVWGLVMAGVSGSSVVLLDGMFNMISGIMSYFSIEITRLISSKETRKFPLGYFAFESLFVLAKGATILVLLLMALYSNIGVLLSGGREPVLGLLTIYVVVAVLGCVILYFICKKGLKQTGSEILLAETKAWLVNAVISGAIGIAFGITMLLAGTPLGFIDRYIDQILVIVLSLIFIKDPLVLMKSGIKELLLAAPRDSLIEPFQEKLLPIKDQLQARDMALELIKTGRRLWLTVRLDPPGDQISLDDLMAFKVKISRAAREVYENTETEVILERN